MRSRPCYSHWGEAHDGEGGFEVSTAHQSRTADGRTGCCLLFLKGDAIVGLRYACVLTFAFVS